MFPHTIIEINNRMSENLAMVDRWSGRSRKWEGDGYYVKLEANQNYPSMIPSIYVQFLGPDAIAIEDMVRFTNDLIERLAMGALKDYYDFQLEMSFDEIGQNLEVHFNHYNIKRC